MEGQILRFYLKVYSFTLIPIIYFIFIFFIKEIELKNDYFIIKKEETYQSIIDNNIIDLPINIYLFKITLRILLIKDIKLYHGKFNLNKNTNFYKLIKLINSPSDYYEKITIVEGWSKKELNNILKNNFNEYKELNYSEIIADTYLFSVNSSFIKFKSKLKKKFERTKEKYKNHYLLKKFSFKEILIIGSLLEKEGLDYDDKKKNIFSNN